MIGKGDECASEMSSVSQICRSFPERMNANGTSESMLMLLEFDVTGVQMAVVVAGNAFSLESCERGRVCGVLDAWRRPRILFTSGLMIDVRPAPEVVENISICTL